MSSNTPLTLSQGTAVSPIPGSIPEITAPTIVQSIATGVLNQPPAIASDEMPNKQLTLIPNELVESPKLQSTPPPIQTKEQFQKRLDQVLEPIIDKENGDPEEITEIDSPAIAQESAKLAHAQDIVFTLSPFIAA